MIAEVAIESVVMIAAAIAAIGVIWRQAIRPVLRAAREAGQSAAVLAEIAAQFRPNHGSSLVDRITFIENELADVRRCGENSLRQHAALAEQLSELAARLENK